MSRTLVGTLLGLAFFAGASRAADVEGKLKSVNPDKNVIVLTIDEKDREFTVADKAEITVQDIVPYNPKDGLKDAAFKVKDRLVRLTTEKKDGKEVVTKLTIYTGRKGKRWQRSSRPSPCPYTTPKLPSASSTHTP